MTTPLKRVAIVIAGQAPPSDAVGDLMSGLPFVQGNAEFGPLHPRPTLECDAAAKVASPGDILLSVRAPVGAINVADQQLGIGRGLAAIRAGAGQDSRYIRYVLHGAISLLRSRATGTTYEAVTADDIGGLPVPQLSPRQQRRIADFLDDQVARIDNIIAARQRQAEELIEAARSRAAELVWRGLHDEAVGSTGVDLAPLAPIRWARRRNKNLLREATELSVNGSEDLLSVSHLTGISLRAEKTVNMFMAESLVGYKVVRPGDLVINTLWAWMGALGVSRVHGIVSPAYGVYTSVSTDFDPGYFDILYRSSAYVCEMTRHSKGVWSSRLRLYPEAFLGLSVIVPPCDEQQQIVAAIEHEVGEYEPLSQGLKASVDLLQELKRSLITAAVTGSSMCRPLMVRASRSDSYTTLFGVHTMTSWHPLTTS